MDNDISGIQQKKISILQRRDFEKWFIGCLIWCLILAQHLDWLINVARDLLSWCKYLQEQVYSTLSLARSLSHAQTHTFWAWKQREVRSEWHAHTWQHSNVCHLTSTASLLHFDTLTALLLLCIVSITPHNWTYKCFKNTHWKTLSVKGAYYATRKCQIIADLIYCGWSDCNYCVLLWSL